MARCEFDMVMLLGLVEERSCLWDKTSDQYKNRILRDRSWVEISQVLDDDYDNKTPEKKKQTGQFIRQKWENIRDAFLRSVRTKPGQAAKKSYLYAEHLQFILKTLEPSDMESNFSRATSPRGVCSMEGQPSGSAHRTRRPLRKSKLHLPNLHPDNKVTSKEKTFFASFQPYIVDMSEDEKLQLHMDIITAIKCIKQRRLGTSRPVASNTSATFQSSSNGT